ncbi:Nif11-like leader peptide family RiPP precursor [Anoxynatronum sibiricum]|uniref:Nif11-like leader peptide family RiPP n=1 Tax=Anoxynatronum sibiricum TaxID=210623 RepID=A0ABU9W091_9CLOT
MEEKMKRFGELMASNEGMAEEVYGLETAEEVQKLLTEKGLDLTLEEIHQMQQLLVKMAEESLEGKEMSEEDLETVAGGIRASILPDLPPGTLSGDINKW